MKRIVVSFIGVGLLFGFGAGAVHARLIQQDASDTVGTTGADDAQFYFDGNISASDLINNGSPAVKSVTFIGTTSTGGSGGGTYDKLTDGKASGKTDSSNPNDLSGDTFFSSGDLAGSPSVTYAFNGSYNLTKLNSIYGWQDTQTFSDQKYTVSVATTANPTFTTLAAIDYTPFRSDVSGSNAPNSSQVTLTSSSGYIATGVTAIRFTFTEAGPSDGLTQAQTGQVIRELDVFGTPVPEPASAALFAVAAAGLMIRRRRS